MRSSRSCPAERAPYRIERSPQFADTVARLTPKAKRWLAEIYQILAVTPLPGQSDLDIQPHPWLPNVYTVPFLDGHLVYAVLNRRVGGRPPLRPLRRLASCQAGQRAATRRVVLAFTGAGAP